MPKLIQETLPFGGENPPAAVVAPVTGEELRDEGAALTLSHVKDSTRRQIVRAIRVLGVGNTFTASSLRNMLNDGAQEDLDAFPNALGGSIIGMAKRRPPWVRNTGRYVQSERPERHAGRSAIWEIIAVPPVERTEDAP